MRLAILCDIHGNLPAFESVLAHAKDHSPDQLVIAGDVISGGPDSLACWQRARDLGCPILRGNQESYVHDLAADLAPPLWHTRQFAPVQWTRAQLGDDLCLAMAELPLFWRSGAAPDLLVVHAALRSDRDNIYGFTPPAELAAMFPDAEREIVRGHNHVAQTRLWPGGRITTSGPVSLPMDGTTYAQYLLLDRVGRSWQPSPQIIEYDHAAALARFHDTGYLRETGPAGRMFYRELLTGALHWVPFLRLYARWREEGVEFAEAVDRFLGLP